MKRINLGLWYVHVCRKLVHRVFKVKFIENCNKTAGKQGVIHTTAVMKLHLKIYLLAHKSLSIRIVADGIEGDARFLNTT